MDSFKTHRQLLSEKLIVVGNGKRYGQVIFLAGGGGSGKDFAQKHFLEGEKFKRYDVDELKRLYVAYSRAKQKNPEIQNLDFRNPDHVFKLHQHLKDNGVKDKYTLNLMQSLSNQSELPNVIFDMTLKDFGSINEVMPFLKTAGYEAKNIHIVWVLTDYRVAVQQNATRERIVPEDVLLRSHEGAAVTMHSILFDGRVPKGVDGGIYIILGGKKHSVMYTGPDGKSKGVVKDFKYIQAKKPGRPVVSDDEIRKDLHKWILDNIPKTKKTAKIWDHLTIAD